MSKLIKVMMEATVENKLTLIERETSADIVAKQLFDKLVWAASGVQWFSYIVKSMVGKEIGVNVLLGSKSLYYLITILLIVIGPLMFACDQTSRDVVLPTSNTKANTNNAVLKSSCKVLSSLTLLIYLNVVSY